MAPFLIGLIVFQLGPLVASLVLSFTNYDIITPVKWVGFANYGEMVRDPLFSKSLLNTVYYVGASIPIRIVLAIAMAMLLNQGLMGTSVFRTVFYLPSVTAGVAISILWRWVYHPSYGAFNNILSVFGIQGPRWLGDTTWAMPAIIIMGIWLVSGRYMVIFLAGLQGIPDQLYEAAKIDGAGRIQQFRYVTAPLLSPTIYLVAVLGVIQSFQVFTFAYILTEGGPADATLVYILYLYRKGFQYFQMGYACALAWILFLIIMGATLVQKQLSSWVYYESGD
jgi:multiple sugar transport system permease protein